MNTINLSVLNKNSAFSGQLNPGIDRAAQSAQELWNRRALVLLDECKTQFCQLKATQTSSHEDVRAQRKSISEKLQRSYGELGSLLNALVEDANDLN